ncbi:hypothetical protein DM01DRAFT_1331686 [Hesseltinella vesiculosa]|uniref:Peroxin/Ferlin domain-containing protein n=1 Tax=Hesseltinella vesiculosa TaxID=101127 RepID=A0A1X2GW19_9FUNG|nr:hypothetical protein DM01DRAFT_1331686 [Hesseltinella vesiculosa]
MASEIQQSFGSPFSLSTLDTIPPLVLKLLVQLGPWLRCVRHTADLLQWQTASPRQSILALLLWNVICLWTWQVLALGLPALVVYKLVGDWMRVRTLRTRRERLERQRLELREKQLRQMKDRDGDQDEDTDEDDDRWNAQRRQQQQEMDQEELISRKIQPKDYMSLDDTLQDIAVINHYVARLTALYRATLPWLDGSRQDILIAVMAALLYMVPAWMLLVLLLGAHGTLALLGSLIILADSPWGKVIFRVLKRNSLVQYTLASLWSYGVAVISSYQFFLLPSQKAKESSKWKSWLRFVRLRAKQESSSALQAIRAAHPQLVVRSEMTFQFEIYENQRWWLGANWTTNMLSTERAAWTDHHLAPVISKDQFNLPESSESTTITKDGKQQKMVKAWTWADNDWWVDMTGELDGRVDLNGWEYGNNAWQHLGGTPGMQTFTRRRRWCRRARLIERLPEDSTNLPSPSALRKRK